MDELTVSNPKVPTFLRVLSAVRLRAWSDGIAYFHRGELAKRVVWIDPATGECGPSVKNVQRDIDECVAMGLFLHGADTVEIHLNTTLNKRG